jgi:hypothetical protein
MTGLINSSAKFIVATTKTAIAAAVAVKIAESSYGAVDRAWERVTRK